MTLGRDARWLLLISLLLGSAWNIFQVDFNLLLADTGYTASAIGVLGSILWAASVAASVPSTWLAARYGYRLTFALALGAFAFGALGFWVAPSVVTAVVVSIAAGLGLGAFNTLDAPFMASNSTDQNRDSLFALQFSTTNLTALGVLLLTGFLLSNQPVGSYDLLLGLMTGFAFLAVAAAFGLRADQPAGDELPSAHWASFTAALRTRAVRRLLLPWCAIMFGAGQLMPYLNLFLKVRFELPTPTINLLFAAVQACTVVAVLLQPFLTKRVGRVEAIALLQVSSVPFLLVIGFVPVALVVGASLVARNALMTAANPAFFALGMGSVDPLSRPALAAALSVVGSAAFAAGSIAYSLSQSLLGFDSGYALSFLSVAALYVAAALSFWRSHARDKMVTV